MRAEHFAKIVVQIMLDAGTRAGEIMMLGAIQLNWANPPVNGDPEDLLAGLGYAADLGWIEQTGPNSVRLTPAGTRALGVR